MDRRESLKALVATTVGLVALPAWARGWSVGDIAGKSVLSTTQQELLASVADTIIPAGDEIGALTVGVDKFLEKLLRDCYPNDVQENVARQLETLNGRAVASHGKKFSECEQSARESLLMAFESSAEIAESDFFKLMKSETIRGFTTSREVLVNYLKYNPAPGHYYGCVDVKA